ncbi:androgen dependent TFPI regulating protein 1 [Hoplias malabaricus]|uniref:androgen dependent TFPI regulating protein 1 n=1 Tax=Hoplias malabaricus TaxID=27720 RepID=UPI00346241EE
MAVCCCWTVEKAEEVVDMEKTNMAAAVKGNSKLCVFIHVLFFAWYVFTLRENCSLQITEKHPGARSYGGRWKYLTFINLVLQTVFFGVCVLTDLIHTLLPSKSAHSRLPRCLVTLRDVFFTVIAFPLGVFVFASFWSLYTYDRNLVYPKYLDDIIPLWLNHAMHTVILPLLLVQMYLQPHKHPSRLNGILALALFASLYLAWVLWVRHISGIWVYPIMARLSPMGLALFLSAASFSLAPLYLLGEKLSHAIWSPTDYQKKKK